MKLFMGRLTENGHDFTRSEGPETLLFLEYRKVKTFAVLFFLITGCAAHTPYNGSRAKRQSRFKKQILVSIYRLQLCATHQLQEARRGI